MAAPRRLRQSVRCPAGHSSAIAERRAIQNSEESLRALSARNGSEEGQKTIRGIVFPTNQKTVAKWRKRTSGRSADWAEGCQIHGADALREGDHRRVPAAQAVATGRLSLCAAAAAAFLCNLIAAVTYRIHIVLTDRAIETPLVRETMARGIQFTNHDRHIYAFENIFHRVCREHQIDHRLTKIRHPWTNGQLERIPRTVCRQTAAGQRNRTIKEATVKRFHYDSHDQQRNHMANFISAYNFGQRLKTLKGLKPYEVICKQWTIEPEKLILNPIHQMPRLNT